VTALLEHLDFTLITRSWFLHCGLKLNSSKLLKGSSKLIIPSTHQFSVDSAEQLVWEEWHFFSNSRSLNFYTLLVFSLYLMIFSFISFKRQKVWGSTVNLPLYQFSASYHSRFILWTWQHNLLLVLFLWIIANSFVSVYRILTKLGTKMHLYTTFLCTQFQGNQITCYHFMIRNFNTFIKK